jgi:hypothetical protein
MTRIIKTVVIPVLIAVIVALLVGTAPPWWWAWLFPPKPPTQFEAAGPIRVASIEHTDGSRGKYFHFYHSDLDNALHRADWNGETLWVKRGAEADSKLVVVWREPHGGTKGDSHGRYVRGAKSGDWQVDDEFYVAK